MTDSFTYLDLFDARTSRANPYFRDGYRLTIQRRLEKGEPLPRLTEADIRYLKRRAADKRYEASVKGKARKQRFLSTEHGQESNKRSQSQYNTSPRGRQRRSDYYYRDPELCNFRTRQWRYLKKLTPEQLQELRENPIKPNYDVGWMTKESLNCK